MRIRLCNFFYEALSGKKAVTKSKLNIVLRVVKSLTPLKTSLSVMLFDVKVRTSQSLCK